MWQVIGIGGGVALAMGFAGDRGQHWAVRVLCLMAFVVAAVALLVAALVGGKGSPGWDVLIYGVMAFAAMSAISWLSWIAAWADRKRGAAAGAAAGVVVIFTGILMGSLVVSAPETVKPEVIEAAQKSQKVENTVVRAQVVESSSVQVSCLCADGGQCTGPRGGRYCVTAAGAKKYADK